MQASGITDNKADVCACIVCLPDRSSEFVPIRVASFYQRFLQFAGAETVRDMKGSKKTNAARILDGLAISYELREFPVDLADLSAVHAAEMLGMPVEQVFKTLVCRTDKAGVVMACIPGAAELDLKALAQAAKSKKAEMVHLKEVLALTGYQRGGCSPLGAKKEYPVFLDASAYAWETIAVSAGRRGEQIVLAPADLERAVHATAAHLTR